VARELAEAFQNQIPEETWIIGELVPGDKRVLLS
jgi:hypothetical protein